MDRIDPISRRDFLEDGTTLGAAAVAGPTVWLRNAGARSHAEADALWQQAGCRPRLSRGETRGSSCGGAAAATVDKQLDPRSAVVETEPVVIGGAFIGELERRGQRRVMNE